jgi:hypothetical protein
MLALAACGGIALTLTGCFGTGDEPEPESPIIESGPFAVDGLEEGAVVITGWFSRHEDPNRTWIVLIPADGTDPNVNVEPADPFAVDPEAETLAPPPPDLATAGPSSMRIVDPLGKIALDGKEYRIEPGMTALYSADGSLIPLDVPAAAVLAWVDYRTTANVVPGIAEEMDGGPMWKVVLQRPVMAAIPKP